MEEFIFKGIDKRTNLYLNISAILFISIIIITLSLFFWLKLAFVNPRFSIILSAFIGFSVIILSLKLISKKISRKWKVVLDNNILRIYYGVELVSSGFVEEVKTITFRGDSRNPKSTSSYLTLDYNQKSIEIIVTNSYYMPFSNLEDIKCFDIFMNELEIALSTNFIKKDRTKSFTEKGILYNHYVKNKNYE